MVQIDIPASFIAGMLFVDVGQRALKNSIKKFNEKKTTQALGKQLCG